MRLLSAQSLTLGTFGVLPDDELKLIKLNHYSINRKDNLATLPSTSNYQQLSRRRYLSVLLLPLIIFLILAFNSNEVKANTPLCNEIVQETLCDGVFGSWNGPYEKDITISLFCQVS